MSTFVLPAAAYGFLVSELGLSDTTPPVVTAPPDRFEAATGEFTGK